MKNYLFPIGFTVYAVGLVLVLLGLNVLGWGLIIAMASAYVISLWVRAFRNEERDFYTPIILTVMGLAIGLFYIPGLRVVGYVVMGLGVAGMVAAVWVAYLKAT